MVSEGGVDRLLAVLRKPVAACAVLLAVYLALSMINDPEGYLGADTGAKVYTIEVMTDRGTIEPEIGYWAEDLDPDGSAHPVFQSVRVDDGWVAVTTLPMLELAAPLYGLGGYRAILVLPMLGGIGAAWSARALSRRVDETSDGWVAFWTVGLASPIVVYALDFWEHSVGVACVVGAIAVLMSIVDGRSPWMGVLAGALLGLGAVMRNEAFVYAIVAVGTICVVLLLRDRSVRRPLAAGVSAVVGFGAVFLANAALEAWVGGLSRTSRATGTASSATSSLALGERFEEGLQTSLGLSSGSPVGSALLGSAVVAAIVVAARAEWREDRTFVLICFGAAVAVYASGAVGGLGFIPGLFVAFPLAVLALLPLDRSSNARIVTVIALAALPFVYLFQFLGGAGPQWGGRYTLASATLLGVVGLTALSGRLPMVGRGALGLSIAATILGIAWLAVRSHSVDDFFDEVASESQSVLISRQGFLLREGGEALVGRRWLSVANQDSFIEAVDIARQVGEERFSVLEWDAEAPPDGALPDDVEEVRRHQLDFLGTPVGLVTYEFDR